MKNVRVAKRYARALLTASEEAKSVPATLTDLQTVRNTLRDSRELRLLIASPVVAAAKKRAIFNELFAKRISAASLRFIEFLISKSRESLISEVIDQFQRLHDEKTGMVDVEVISAVDLTQQHERNLQSDLNRYTGKNVRLQRSVDRSIQGGLVIKIGDTVLDASVRRQLEVLRAKLMGDTGSSSYTRK